MINPETNHIINPAALFYHLWSRLVLVGQISNAHTSQVCMSPSAGKQPKLIQKGAKAVAAEAAETAAEATSAEDSEKT